MRGMSLRYAVYRAINGLRRCQTGELGTRVYTCPEHGEVLVPNSCRRRDCPQCCGARAFRWTALVERRLLRCVHFHVVFTLPADLAPYWRHNRALMADLLFDAAVSTLKELLADPKYMGGTPAILGVLHTHGSALTLHPHVHLLVSAVGLSPDGVLVRCRRRNTLLPYRVLRTMFQMKFLDGLQRLADKPCFYLPSGTTGPQLRRLISEMFAQPPGSWNVMAFERSDPRPVVRYLSRTVYGGAIRNDRILGVTPGSVTFQYVDWRDRTEEGSGRAAKLKKRTLSLADFVSYWSEHIADPGQKTVRYWGLFAPGAKANLDRARHLLDQDPTPDEKSPDDRTADEPVVCCPHCDQSDDAARAAARPAPSCPAGLGGSCAPGPPRRLRGRHEASHSLRRQPGRRPRRLAQRGGLSKPGGHAACNSDPRASRAGARLSRASQCRRRAHLTARSTLRCNPPRAGPSLNPQDKHRANRGPGVA